MRHTTYACATWSRAVETALGLLLFFACCATAQDFRAKLTVTVSDPSGLAVPGATLDLTNANNGEVSSAKANETGVHSFLFLLPGSYNLKVSAPGFKPAVRENIVLQSYQASGLEIRMEVGGVADAVTVTDEGALLQTETASRGMNVDSRLVTDVSTSCGNQPSNAASAGSRGSTS